MSNVQFLTAKRDGGQQFITVVIDGRLQHPIDNTHPNFDAIKTACQQALEGADIDGAALASLFDVAKTVSEKFQQLSDRISVQGGTILLDGDPVNGELQDQILDFLDNGEDFDPLVRFYEKLLTNPLGDIQEALYSWIAGQRTEGNFTITPDGDVLGYKSVYSTGGDAPFRPSRSSKSGGDRVNGVEVQPGAFILQSPGDAVEMPRSKVLHAPSQECGDGLHIGTWAYAKSFQGDTVLLVRFSPRDIVSVPDGNSTWKLRVRRYEVVGPVTEPLNVPVYGDEADLDADVARREPDLDLSLPVEIGDAEFRVGERLRDVDGDEGIVVRVDEDGHPVVQYDDPAIGTLEYDDPAIGTLEYGAKTYFHFENAKGERIELAVNPRHPGHAYSILAALDKAEGR